MGKMNSTKYSVIELSAVIAAAITALLIKNFLFDIVKVSGTSMMPSICDNDYIVVEKFIDMKKIKRQQIVIFDPGKHGSNFFIKRIIGLPHDNVEIRSGVVYVNGCILKENYLSYGTYTEPDLSITVPKDSIFVLGDNREMSSDSRVLGTIPVKNIKSRAVYRVFPLNKLCKFK